MKDQARYTIPLVAKLLENYARLEEGKLPDEGSQTGYIDWGTVISRSRSMRAPYEMATLLKADIDRAIRHLKMTPKFVVTHHAIGGRAYEWCAYLLGREETQVIQIELGAIRQMANFLNGA